MAGGGDDRILDAGWPAGQQFHQANAVRLIGIKQLPGKQHALGLPRPDQIDQQFHIVQRIDNAQFRRRDAKAGRWRGDAQIAGQRQATAAAHRVAFHPGDCGQRKARQIMLGLVDRGLVGGQPFGIVLVGKQLGDIGPGAECPTGMRGLHQQQAQIGQRRRLCQQARQQVPHGQREGIALVGAVDQQPGDGAIMFQAQAHGASPCNGGTGPGV